MDEFIYETRTQGITGDCQGRGRGKGMNSSRGISRTNWYIQNK